MSAFAEYATGSAFVLNLSKAQVRALCQFDDSGSSFEKFMTVQALRSKGLIEHKGDRWFITEPGKLVVRLLKEAGLYETKEQALERLGVRLGSTA